MDDSAYSSDETFEHENIYGFSNCISKEEQQEILSTNETIILRITHTCYCYDHNPRRPFFITVRKSPEKSHITVRDAIDGIINSGYEADCNHSFLEGFDKISDVQFEPFFGS